MRAIEWRFQSPAANLNGHYDKDDDVDHTDYVVMLA